MWRRAQIFLSPLLACLFLLQVQILGQTAPADSMAPITSALRAGQFDRALELLQPELQRDPSNPKLWTLEGIALANKSEKTSRSEKKGALEAFHRALNVAPDYLPALEGAAQIEYENGGKDAPELLEHILRLRPNEPTSHAMLAVLAYRSGDCGTAIRHFEQSASLVNTQPGALQAYAECLARNKEFDKAIALLSAALAQPNVDPAVRSQLASVQLAAQHPKDAIATLQPVLQANTADAETLSLAAGAFEADGNTPEAVRILRQAVIADPHNVNLYLDFANLCLDHQSYEVGIDMINAGLAAEPKAAALYVARGVLNVQLAQYEKAETDFEIADTLDPRRSVASGAEGLAAVQANDPERALATVREKLVKRPNDAFLLYLQADILTQRGPDTGSAEFRQAMESAKKAIALRPSLTAAHDVLAKLYLQEGEIQPALEQCRKALSLDAKDQTALYHMVQALRKSGQTEEIPALLKRLADLRMAGTKEEAEHNRYKLVEEKPTTEHRHP